MLLLFRPHGAGTSLNPALIQWIGEVCLVAGGFGEASVAAGTTGQALTSAQFDDDQVEPGP